MENGCRKEVRYICTMHRQVECKYFKEERGLTWETNNVCLFGLPDRECCNLAARKEAKENET